MPHQPRNVPAGRAGRQRPADVVTGAQALGKVVHEVPAGALAAFLVRRDLAVGVVEGHDGRIADAGGVEGLEVRLAEWPEQEARRGQRGLEEHCMGR